MRIRLATRNDAEVIAGHRLAMFTDMGTLPAGADVEALRRAAAAYLREAIGSEYFGWLACADDDVVVGGCGMQLRRILPRFSRGGAVIDVEGIILNVYTDAGWRRRGVAEELMRACLAWARERGVERIVLHASPEGRRLYEKLGFVQTNEMRLHHS
ncbi:MAG TPA: GNAT family N-acetyltransferase [Thermoanaerobaculia bacterium]|nr:GNAT family N-acetyltransferase [Thermoanaerobaculia bacterium]